MTASAGVSITAQRVAAYRLGFARAPAPFGDPEAEERLARDVAGVGDFDRSERMERYLRARTAFFDRVVVGALERGVTQVVVVGAGYDGRALRYAKPGVRWFEVDHPATHADKRARLERLGLEAGHVAFVAADLTRPGLGAALTEHGCATQTPSLMLCEGVAVYLEEAVIASVARELGSVAAAGSAFAISGSPVADPELRRRFEARVAAIGEPARSSTTAAELNPLLEAAGWHATQLPQEAADAGFVVARRGYAPSATPTFITT